MIAVASAVLGNVEHDKSPSLIPPFASFRRECDLLTLQCNRAPTSLCNFHALLAIFFDKTHIALDGETARRSARLKCKLIPLLSHNMGKYLKYVWRNGGNCQCYRDSKCRKNRFLHILFPPAFFGTFFKFSHIPILHHGEK